MALELMTEHPTVRLLIEYVTLIAGLNVALVGQLILLALIICNKN